ncbi:MAG: tetratricopeptide repeat protein [Candidatus Lokiarchaeota archaeon]|nr:tetratricopeptide repeat protein [Candidatus Lokiarchaeota archaeon]
MTKNLNDDTISQILTQAIQYMDRCEFDKAIVELKQGLIKDPRNVAFLERIAICNLELKQPKLALQTFDEILSINPNSWRVWADKAFMHLLLDEEEPGIEALERSLKLNPRNGHDWELLALAYIGKEMWAEACDALEILLQLEPNSAMAWYNYAVCNFFMENNEIALMAAERAFAIDPLLNELGKDWIEIAKMEIEEYRENEFLIGIIAS